MRSFDEWFDENCDGSDLAKDACRKLWDEFSDQINIICRKSYEKQQSKVDELQKQLIDQGQRFNEQSQRVKDLEHKNGELQKRVDGLLEHEEDMQRRISDLETTLRGIWSRAESTYCSACRMAEGDAEDVGCGKEQALKGGGE